METRMICPECKKEAMIIVKREPIDEGITTMTGNVFTASTQGNSSYSTTDKTFKCSNPKCWVTKIKVSWE